MLAQGVYCRLPRVLFEVWGIVYGFPVLQALAVNLLNRPRDPLPVIHLAGIPAELEFIRVVGQVLGGTRLR